MARLKKNQVKHRKHARKPLPRKKQTSGGLGLIIGTLLAAVLIAAVAFYLRPTTGSSGVVRSFDLTSLPVLGQADAPATLVVVEDFKCPACRAFEQDVMPQLVSKYVNTGKLKVASLTWPFLAKARNLPTDDSLFAAEAARCVYDQLGSAGYYGFKKVLFGNQGDETTVWATKDKLKTLASGLSQLDQSKFGTCLNSDATRASVQDNQKQVTAAGITSTPSVFVDGQSVTPTLEALSTAIDNAAPAAP
ncbi:DsbA family protein [Deinococcus rubellus]|uniref:DsbA family protein n=1 Tax=Deinococcus rubellus TaxID=1889240 RepID=A0ABY5YJZ1_9DEIO|nr:DsbA family protein [Deinococcus rubellus]UWX65432.1 DsbA family protein [Deinococcus rubellus]